MIMTTEVVESQNRDIILNNYNDLCTSIYVVISKINANIEHGKNYGIISNKISENLIKLFEYDLSYNHDSYLDIINNKNTELKKHLHLLNNILEKQRMCFVVNYFCNTNTKTAFPKYLLPLLKRKYIKLYGNIIFQTISSKIYFQNYDLVELN